VAEPVNPVGPPPRNDPDTAAKDADGDSIDSIIEELQDDDGLLGSSKRKRRR
jgi:hypothetical protein